MTELRNDEYYVVLEARLQELKRFRASAKNLAAGIIGQTLYTEDLFFSSALDRSVALLDGIVDMLKSRNLACVGILVRSQIDNCMRIFAAFIAENRLAFMEGFLKGRKISDFRDDRGEKMRDKVLRDRLKAYDSQINDVYEKASGYVHFSDTAFFSSVRALDNFIIEFSVGLPLKEEANITLLEGADAFIHYTSVEYELLQTVVESKMRIDRNHNPSSDAL